MILKPSGLTSVKVNYRKIAVRQELKVPSPDIFVLWPTLGHILPVPKFTVKVGTLQQ